MGGKKEIFENKMNDLEFQLSFSIKSVDRILTQIDLDPLSPTFGCAHLEYWRDKTSDFPDARRQESVLTLALLYSFNFPGSNWKSSPKLKFIAEAMLGFWCKNQYLDGSMDEWYKGERAYAAAAFSVHAVARTFFLMKNDLSEPLAVEVQKKVSLASKWLAKRDDLFKTNHQAVGVLALAWASKILNDEQLESNARIKLQSIIKVQTREGWFPEIGNMDLGYTFLTVEFVSMAMDLLNDWKDIEPFKVAFDFACEWIHPDLTFGKEYSICQNAYLSRIAIILMSQHSKRANYLLRKLKKEQIGFEGLAPFLTDDLRLLRWSYMPLLAYQYAEKFPVSPLETEPVPLARFDSANKIFKESVLARFSCGRRTGVFAGVAGGLVRLLNENSEQNFSDYGYAINVGESKATNITYDREISINEINGEWEVVCNFHPVKKFFPPYWMRILLRLACKTSSGSRLSRKFIDFIRRKKGTPINQSSSNLRVTNSPWQLIRILTIHEDHIQVLDKLTFEGMIRRDDLFFLESGEKGCMEYSPITSKVSCLPELLKQLEVRKIYQSSDHWVLKELSVNF